MNPLQNTNFGHDAANYVYQNRNVGYVPPVEAPTKPFKIEAPVKADKSSKDLCKKETAEKKTFRKITFCLSITPSFL